MLKYLLVALALCAVVSSNFTQASADGEWKPKTRDEVIQIRSECLKEHPLSGEQISSLQQLIFPDETNVREYLLCTATKLDIFCNHKGYHADRLAKLLVMELQSEEEALQIAQSCSDSNSEKSPVDVWAFRGYKCMMASKVGDNVRASVKAKQEEVAKANKV